MAGPNETPSVNHRVGIAEDGLYQGLIKAAANVGGLVDMTAAGMNKIGINVGNKPVGGSEWIKGALTSAYNSYNKAIGYTPPTPVDKTDKVIHVAADLAGQVVIPVTAAATAGRIANAATTTKDVIESAKKAKEYTSSVGDATGMTDDAIRAAKSAAAAYGIGGEIKTAVSAKAAFTASASGAAVAVPAMAVAAEMKPPTAQPPKMSA